MISHKFSPLKNNWPKLYEHAAKAEQYISSDPHAAIVKLRCYAELLVEAIYNKLSFSSIGMDNFYERLSNEQFRKTVPNDVRTKLHAIRVWGNKAAHGDIDLGDEAKILLKDAYLLGKWFYKTIDKDDNQYPDFSMPKYSSNKNEKNITIEKLTNQLEQALSELSNLQIKYKNVSNLPEKETDEELLQKFTKNGLRAATQINMEPENTAKLFSLKDAFLEYKLTHDQTILVEKLDEFLKSKTENVFLMQGYAGTGKTFITKGLTEYFKIIGRNYILAAPTGKAAKVIEAKAKSPANTIHTTIYSFKDIKEYSQEIEGSETFKFYAELAVNTNSADTVYIVDEASMISDKYHEAEFFRFGSGFLLKDFLKFVNLDHNDHRKKVIFIGDNAQLPPVGMNISPALNSDYLQKKYNLSVISYTLTDVVRQKGDSGIIKNASMLRKSLDEKCFNMLIMNSSLPDVHEIKYEDVIESYIRACNGKIGNNTVLIAFSNADVTAYNSAIRKQILPGCSDEIYPGDKIMANNNSSFYGFFISNGEFGIVHNVRGNTEIRNVTLKHKNNQTKLVEEIPITLRFRKVELGFRDEDGTPRFFDAIILENLLYSDQQDISSDENKALYVDFCIRNSHIKRGSKEFKDTLKTDPYFNALRVKFGYAITCHKAQGSEWQHVFVKCRNTNAGLTESYFRWLYTAITRASEHLYLIDPPKYKLTSGLKPIGFTPVQLSSPMQFADHPSTEQNEEPVISTDSRRSSALVNVPETGNSPCPEASLSTVSTDKEKSVETFGIIDDHPFLLVLLHRVKELISGTGIEITSVSHHNFQEAYFFKDNTETVRINIWYKAKGLISSVSAQNDSPLSQKLVKILNNPLKALSFCEPHQIQHIEFPEQFMKDFYDEVVSIVSNHDISVQHVKFIQYSQRYTFVRGNEVATFDFWYNSKKQFKKFSAYKSSQSSITFEKDIAQLLTNIV